jgi:ParB family chromosome partitioning protein
VAAVVLSPARDIGLEPVFYVRPRAAGPDPVEPDPAFGDEEPECALAPERREIEVPAAEVDLTGLGHGLHERRTDLATRGLIRDLADAPAAALTALTAQLFKQLALHDRVPAEASALAVVAHAYRWGGEAGVAALDGTVRERLAQRRAAYLASGLRPIPFVAGLAVGERMSLLAELVALALDLREPRTSAVRAAARAEAREIAELCGADLAAHWTPDAAFLGAHTRAQILGMLAEMGVEDARARGLKKPELAAFAAEAAAERGWAPAALGWRAPGAEACGAVDGLDAAAPPGAEGGGSGETPGTAGAPEAG